MTTISITNLEALCNDILVLAGMKETDANDVVVHYIENEMSGKASHGAIRVIEAYNALTKHGVSTDTPKMEIDNGALVSVNAMRKLGPLAGNYAAETAIKRAKIHGIALVGIRNYIGSAGSMSFYLRRLTAEKKLAIMGCNSNAMAAAPDGREPVIGTNPLGIGIPAYEDNNAMIADFATTELAYGKIAVMKAKGEAIPHGLMIDEQGNPSNSPADAFDGAMLPFCGYKGFSVGLMVEMMSAFIGATPHNRQPYEYDNDGLFIIAMDPAKMHGEQFLRQASKSFKYIRSGAPLPAKQSVNIPGDRSDEFFRESKASGNVDVAGATLEKLNALLEQRSV